MLAEIGMLVFPTRKALCALALAVLSPIAACSGSDSAPLSPVGVDADSGTAPDTSVPPPSTVHPPDAAGCAADAAGDRFALWFIEHDAAARRWLIAEGARLKTRIGATGATKSNALWEAGPPDGGGAAPELAIEGQRVGYDLVAAGLAEIVEHPGDPAYTASGSTLDIGLRAIEWALAQRTKTSTGGVSCNDTKNPSTPPITAPDSWPCERGGAKDGGHSLHPKSELIRAAALAAKLIVDAGAPRVPPSYLDRIDRSGGVKDALRAVGAWLKSEAKDGGDVTAFRKIITDGSAAYDPTHANFNQQLFVPVALFAVGRVTGEASFVATAEDWMTSATYGVLKEERVLAGTAPPASVLPENAYVGLGLEGFDASYQSVSLDLLIDYAGALLTGDAFRTNRVLPILARAFRRLEGALVRPAGSTWQVDGAHDHNTRTCECGDRVSDDGEIEMPLRLLRYARLTCDDGLASKALEVRKTGQTFSHFQDCSSSAAQDGDLCRPPF